MIVSLVLIDFLLAGKESDKSINMNEEKKQREQILALNQVVAQQVIAKSRASQGKLSSSLSDISISLLLILSLHTRSTRVESQGENTI